MYKLGSCILAFGLSLSISGCATMSPEDLKQWDTYRICDTLTMSLNYMSVSENPNAQMMLAELRERNEFSAQDIDVILRRSIYVGMPEYAMRCSYGKPQRINSTITQYGKSKQYVYLKNHVYVEKGKVTAWQSSSN